jgi:hypothetical protein
MPRKAAGPDRSTNWSRRERRRGAPYGAAVELTAEEKPISSILGRRARATVNFLT